MQTKFLKLFLFFAFTVLFLNTYGYAESNNSFSNQQIYKALIKQKPEVFFNTYSEKKSDFFLLNESDWQQIIQQTEQKGAHLYALYYLHLLEKQYPSAQYRHGIKLLSKKMMWKGYKEEADFYQFAHSNFLFSSFIISIIACISLLIWAIIKPTYWNSFLKVMSISMWAISIVISSFYFSTPAPDYLFAKTDQINLYVAPAAAASIQHKINYGQRLKCIENIDDVWVKARYQNQVLYARKNNFLAL